MFHIKESSISELHIPYSNTAPPTPTASLPWATVHLSPLCSEQENEMYELFPHTPYPLAYSCFWLVESSSRSKGKMRVEWVFFPSAPFCWVPTLETQLLIDSLLLSCGQPLWVPSPFPPLVHPGLGVVINPNHCQPQSTTQNFRFSLSLLF